MSGGSSPAAVSATGPTCAARRTRASVDADDVGADERHGRRRQGHELRGRAGDGVALVAGKCLGDRVAGKRAREQAVDDVLLVGDPEVGELRARVPLPAMPSARAGSRTRPSSVSASPSAVTVASYIARFVSSPASGPKQLAPPGSSRCTRSTPRAGSTTERMTRRCSIEQHMVERGRRLRIRDQHAERIERRDLHGALPRQLLLDGRNSASGTATRSGAST